MFWGGINVKISACVITKNEEHNLLRCLNSVQSIVSEIIVVDTGSTDNTVEVARQFGAKIFKFEWVNDFSKARNYAISKAKGEWIIFLDADENFTAKSAKNIMNLIKSAKNRNLHAIGCMLSNLNQKGDVINSFLAVRIFENNPFIRYLGAIHETLTFTKGKLRLLNTANELQILHTGYSDQEIKRKNKGNRNKELLFKELEKNPNSSDLHFYISEALFIDNDFQRAVEYALKAKELNSWNGYGLPQKNFLNIIQLMLYAFKSPVKEVNKIIQDALRDFPTFPDFHIYQADLFLLEDRFEDAIESFNIAIRHMDEVLTSQTASYIYLDKVLEKLANCYHLTGNIELSVKNYVESIKFNKYHIPSIIALIKILSKTDTTNSIKDFFVKIYDLSNLKDIVYLFKASLFASNAELGKLFYSYFEPVEKEKLKPEEAMLRLLSGECEAALDKFHLLYEATNEESYLEKSFVASLLSENGKFQQEIDYTIAPLKKFGERLLGLNALINETDKQSILNVISVLVSISMEVILIEIIEVIQELNLCFNVAEILYKNEKYQAAFEYYTKCLENDHNIVAGDKAIILVRMADCLFHNGQLELAIQLLKDAKNYNPKNYSIYSLGIKISEELKDKENVYLFCVWGLKEFPISNFLTTIQKKFPNNKDNLVDLITKL